MLIRAVGGNRDPSVGLIGSGCFMLKNISDTDTIVDQNCMCVVLYKCYEFTNDFNRILK